MGDGAVGVDVAIGSGIVALVTGASALDGRLEILLSETTGDSSQSQPFFESLEPCRFLLLQCLHSLRVRDRFNFLFLETDVSVSIADSLEGSFSKLLDKVT